MYCFVAHQETNLSKNDSNNDNKAVVDNVPVSAPSFQSNGFEIDMSMPDQKSHNPFITTTQQSTVVPNPTEIFMNVKNTNTMNRYDIFRNELDNHITPILTETNVNEQSVKQKTEVNPELFKDFALAAFNEFKFDSKSSLVHEFSNKLAEQNKNGRQTTNNSSNKVINNKVKPKSKPSSLDSHSTYISRECLTNINQ